MEGTYRFYIRVCGDIGARPGRSDRTNPATRARASSRSNRTTSNCSNVRVLLGASHRSIERSSHFTSGRHLWRYEAIEAMWWNERAGIPKQTNIYHVTWEAF